MTSPIKPQFTRGLTIRPDDVGVENIEGEIKVALTSKKLQIYIDGALRSVVLENSVATLTNKTIDADTNTLSNLEVDNLKSGVLNTSTSLSSASDTQLPSALAVKTYVDASTASKDQASEISFVPVGNIVATNVQTLGQELDADLTSEIARASAAEALVQSNLTTEIANRITDVNAEETRALAAEALVQTNLNTHMADTSTHGVGEIVGASEAQTLTNKTIDAQDNDITNINGGNISPFGITSNHIIAPAVSRAIISDGDGKLAASAVSSTELSYLDGVTSSVQTQLDEKALDADLTAHVVATNNVHGITGNVVGDSDAQTLSNKTITAPIINGGVINDATIDDASIETPTRLDVKQDTFVNLSTYAASATNGQLCFATDTKTMYQVVDLALAAVGGGGSSSLDTIFQLYGAELLNAWATGNNATFLGGGTVAGTFAYETSSPLAGTNSYKFTQAAGSLNDYIASPVQSVPVRFRGNAATLYFPYLYNGGSSDLEPVVYDVTNATKLTSTANLLPSTGTNTSIYKVNVVIPLTCTQVRIGFQVKVLNSGKVLQFDDVQFTSNTTVYAELSAPDSSVRVDTANGYGSTATKIRRFTNIRDNIGTDVEYLDSATNGASFTAKTAGIYSICYMDYFGATGNAGITKNSANLTTNIGTLNLNTNNEVLAVLTNASGYFSPVSWEGYLSAGDVIRAHTNGDAATDNDSVKFTISKVGKTSTNIITAPDTFSTDTNTLTYASSSAYTLATLNTAPVGTFITFTYSASTRTQTTTAPTQTTADMNVNGLLIYARAYSAASTAANPACFAIQIGKGLKGISLGLYKSTGKQTSGQIDYFTINNANFGIPFKEYNEATGVLVVDAGWNASSTNTVGTFNYSDVTQQASGYLVINASKNPALTGLNIQSYYTEAVNNAAQAITANVTNIPFIATANTAGNWNGSLFTASTYGVYLFNVGVAFNAGVSTGLSFVKNNTTSYRFTTPASAASFHAGSFTITLLPTETISIRTSDAGGTLSSSINHRLTVTKTNVG